jgi:hypothetical protein
VPSASRKRAAEVAAIAAPVLAPKLTIIEMATGSYTGSSS